MVKFLFGSLGSWRSLVQTRNCLGPSGTQGRLSEPFLQSSGVTIQSSPVKNRILKLGF